MKQTFGKTKTMSKDDGIVAAKTRRQVDNAVSWLEKRYFTEEVRAKKELNESAGHLANANKSDKNSSR
ncbi:MAG: hypothetical protein WB988_10865 [Candidatus Nitrosopolaris sp.]|jgi:phage host-nuclease inhibitor protein Gam